MNKVELKINKEISGNSSFRREHEIPTDPDPDPLTLTLTLTQRDRRPTEGPRPCSSLLGVGVRGRLQSVHEV